VIAQPPNPQEVDAAYSKLENGSESMGYHLNPDADFARELVAGLLVNEKRYGYQACPCRLASGVKSDDLDIICPCDYRDADIAEYGACYCGLYVSKAVGDGEKKVTAVPERRTGGAMEKGQLVQGAHGVIAQLSFPVWRCRVCGYLCAREQPPETCPVCKAKKERFERFL